MNWSPKCFRYLLDKCRYLIKAKISLSIMKARLSGNFYYYFNSIVSQIVYVNFLLPFLLFQAILWQNWKWWRPRQTAWGMTAAQALLGCVWFYVLLIINVWEFCQKSWASGSFCSSVSVVVYILYGTQMWFIVRGVMQLGKIGLFQAMQTRSGERVHVNSTFLSMEKKHSAKAHRNGGE